MSTYGFRLRFFLPEGSVINHDSETLEIKLDSAPSSIIKLASNTGMALKKSYDLSMFGTGFSSEDEAYNCGIRIKNSLFFCTTQLQMGVDCGKDKSSSGIGKIIKDKLKEQGILLLDNVHGLSAYPEDKIVRFGGISAAVTIGRPSEKFAEDFKKAYEVSLNFSDKLSLSFELYGASHFEKSLRAKFLSLITAIESLCEQENNSEAAVRHIEDLINQTISNFHGPEKESIINRLGQLKKESISRACKKTVADNLESEDVAQFEYLYNVRSRMLHDGRTPKGVDLGTEVPKLDKIVSKLLIKVAEKKNR